LGIDDVRGVPVVFFAKSGALGKRERQAGKKILKTQSCEGRLSGTGRRLTPEDEAMISVKKIKETLVRQSAEIKRLSDGIGKPFEKALDLLRSCKGTIVVIGFGKSGAVGAKLAATFRSAGRHACLINPVEAFHGEAASISADDVAILLSSSGESDEIMRIIPWLKKKKVRLIAITPSERSSIARAADIVLKTVMPADGTDSLASYSTCLSALAL